MPLRSNSYLIRRFLSFHDHLSKFQNQQENCRSLLGGVGPTGQILAAWLIAGRGFSKQAAIKAVRQTGRNPYEAVIAAPLRGENPLRVLAELNNLLDACNPLDVRSSG